MSPCKTPFAGAARIQPMGGNDQRDRRCDHLLTISALCGPGPGYPLYREWPGPSCMLQLPRCRQPCGISVSRTHPSMKRRVSSSRSASIPSISHIPSNDIGFQFPNFSFDWLLNFFDISRVWRYQRNANFGCPWSLHPKLHSRSVSRQEPADGPIRPATKIFNTPQRALRAAFCRFHGNAPPTAIAGSKPDQFHTKGGTHHIQQKHGRCAHPAPHHYAKGERPCCSVTKSCLSSFSP